MAYSFTADQLSTAQQVLAEANREGEPQIVDLALMEAGLTESGMQNLTYGDRDSQGVFQERPSQGWTNVRDIAAATRQMIAHMNKSLTDPGAMAQSGEGSAYPDRYDQHRAEAEALLAQVAGLAGPVAPGGGTAAAGDPALSIPGAPDVGQALVDEITKLLFGNGVAVRLGLIVFGGIIVLAGMWVALGHPTSQMPVLGSTMASAQRGLSLRGSTGGEE